MASAESEGGDTRVNVLPVVVGIGDVKVAGVLLGVAIGVADEGALPMVVEVRVGDGNPLAGVGDVDEAVVVVLVVVHVIGHIDVVNPDVLGVLDGENVAVLCHDLGHLHVPDNDVGLLVDGETNTRHACHRVAGSVTLPYLQTRHGRTRLTRARCSNDGLVGLDADLGVTGDGSLHDNDHLAAGLGSSRELRQG